MKALAQKIISNVLLKPIKVNHCSQTIYEVLLGTLRLWEATNDLKWKQRAHKVCDILLDIQRADGGFDIGYDFNFGRLHKKGESTSPELVSLLALSLYYKHFPNKKVEKACHDAAQWIQERAYVISDDMWAIPYGPYSINEVMVSNGTSFASTALGAYLSCFPNSKLDIIYKGMNKYLLSVMTSSEPGKFWFYNDQGRNDLNEQQRSKIDYYHQMQQVEVHSEAQFINPDFHQKELIIEATKHVAKLQGVNTKIPYYNTHSPIHLWGYCSCASGFVLASKIDVSNKDEYITRAKKIYEWIKNISWNGSYFYPIISHHDQVLDRRFYVRSDAWVFNSFSLAVLNNINKEEYLQICEKSYVKMESCNFSGLENHASNFRKRFFTNLINNSIIMFKKIWRK